MKSCIKRCCYFLACMLALYAAFALYIKTKEILAIKSAAQYLKEKYEQEMEYVPGSMEPLSFGDSAWDFIMKFQTSDTKIPFTVGVAFDLKTHTYNGRDYIPWDHYISARFSSFAEQDISRILELTHTNSILDEWSLLFCHDGNLYFRDLQESMTQNEMAELMWQGYYFSFSLKASLLEKAEEQIAEDILSVLEIMRNSDYCPQKLRFELKADTDNDNPISIYFYDWQEIVSIEQVLSVMETEGLIKG